MSKHRRVRARAMSMFAAVGLVFAGVAAWSPPPAQGARVLLVGSYHGKKGGYSTIQAAVDAARPGDWILVGPGDYHETADESGPPVNPGQGQMGGVYIDKAGITLRGMDRSSVIVDGTRPGTSPCSAAPAAQDFGALGTDGRPVGRNGILVWKANNVSVENLTVCNFLAGSGASGNEVWWNGGDGSGTIGLSGYWGSYLTTTSTFFADESTAAAYGIFASNSAGPARLDNLYANNMNDSGTYVGACLQACDVTLDHIWMEYNALGYSGTNSGGTIVVANSRFDHNQDGFDTNTQVIGDPPAPQNGQCPGGATSPITHTSSCWVVVHNLFDHNNDPNNPANGSAAAGPTGTGMTISGGRNDTVLDNTFADNGAWGLLIVPYAQNGTPSLGQTCSGAGGIELPPFGCTLDPQGNAVVHNTFVHDGYFGNPTNGDYAQVTLFPGEPQNCYRGNRAPDGSTPVDLEQTQAQCGVITTSANTDQTLFGEVLCDTGLAPCPPGANYPAATGVVLHPVPRNLATMPDPCAGVPDNPWCGGHHDRGGDASARTAAAGPGLAAATAATRRRSAA